MIDLDGYKTYMGISSPNMDEEIESRIEIAEALAANYCGISFTDYSDTPVTERFDGGYKMILTHYPIIDVEGVYAGYGDTPEELIEYVDWVLDVKESRATIVFLNAPKPIKPSWYSVKYRAGFDELPKDLEAAIFDLVTYYRQNDGAIHSAKTVGSNTVQIEYITNTGLPAHIRRVLDMYRTHYA